jgi:drug/metabolite transporter (DMT)-like permease
MIAVLGGLVAAIAWTIGVFSSARASRAIGAGSTLAGVSVVGLVLSLPMLPFDRLPGPGDEEDLAWLTFAGLGYAIGLLASYAALARGKVGIASPIASTEGAIAAALAVIAGEAASIELLAALGLVVLGVILATLDPDRGDPDATGGSLFLLFAFTAAILFGTSIYAAGHASQNVPAAWVVIAGRIAGVLVIALPLLLAGRLRFDRAIVPFLVLSGTCEVVGYLAITFGFRESIAVTAVIASQFAAMVAVVGHRWFGERLVRHQFAGVAVVGVGVGAVTLIQTGLI